jgi:hypothetical protein
MAHYGLTGNKIVTIISAGQTRRSALKSGSGVDKTTTTPTLIYERKKKYTLQYLRQLRKQSYDYQLSRNSHYLITFDGKVVAIAAGISGDSRSLEKLKAVIRRFSRERLQETSVRA